MSNKDFYYIQEIANGDRIIKSVNLSGSGEIFTVDENGEILTSSSIDASIQIRRGTATELSSVILEEGELAYATDTEIVYIGDGVTAGGNRMSGGVYEEVEGPLASNAKPIFDDGNTITNSNSSFIVGGDNNTISCQDNASIVSGDCNQLLPSASGLQGSASTIVSGRNNKICHGYANGILAGDQNIIEGGSATSSITSGCINNIKCSSITSILGGFCNNVYRQYSSSIIGGLNNTICSPDSSAVSRGNFIGGGSRNTICGEMFDSVIVGGSSNCISFFADISDNLTKDQNGTIGGGAGNVVGARMSTIIGGYYAKTGMYGESARASGKFVNVGDAQIRDVILRNDTSESNSVNLYLNGVNEEITIPANTSWYYDIDVVARNGDDVETNGYNFRGVIERSALATLILSNANKTIVYEDNVNWDCNITVTGENEEILSITGDVEAGQNQVYWVAHAKFVQVTIPSIGCCC